MVGIPLVNADADIGPTDTVPGNAGPMTVDEFYAFTDTRPDHEKWELIEGEPILNAAPSLIHQWIAVNVVVALKNREREIKALGWSLLILAFVFPKRIGPSLTFWSIPPKIAGPIRGATVMM